MKTTKTAKTVKRTKTKTGTARAKSKSGTSSKSLRDVMTAPVFTVTAGQTASDAWALMRAEDVRHAVVLRGRAIIGVLSDRDLGGPNGGAVRRGKTVGDLMQEDPVVAPVDTPIGEAADLVAASRVGCLPVLDGKKLVGVVTRSDLLRLIAKGKTARAVRPGAADLPKPPRLTSPNRDKHL